MAKISDCYNKSINQKLPS